MDILKKIVSYKKEFLKRQKKILPQEKLLEFFEKGKEWPESCFAKKIREKGVHLIAELKKASPSLGIIRKDFNLISIAKGYERSGSACLSILTEDKFFKGDISYLKEVRKAVSLPLLRKDFIIDEYQVYESKLCGADAILLIVSILSSQDLKWFLEICKKMKLDAVVEVHDSKELKKALTAGAEIIGINTRNLKDFSVNLNILPELLKKIPRGKLVIAESGIKTVDDLVFMKKLKVNAVLVGEALMREKNPASKAKEFADFLKLDDKS